MALVAIVTYDTPENDRWWMTRQTIESLSTTVKSEHHRVIVVDNGSTDERTLNFLFGSHGPPHLQTEVPSFIIRNEENLGTARAINQAWILRHPDEVAVKMDNDVVIHQDGWLDIIEETFLREPSIGILGLKRKDLDERPGNPISHYQSVLHMIRQEKGERWIVVEYVNHVMGTCQAYNPLLLEKIGYLEQGDTPYGFDDALSAIRCKVAGFKSAFLPCIEIDHIDPGGTDYCKWKTDIAGKNFTAYNEAKDDYFNGKRPIYCGPEGRPWGDSTNAHIENKYLTTEQRAEITGFLIGTDSL